MTRRAPVLASLSLMLAVLLPACSRDDRRSSLDPFPVLAADGDVDGDGIDDASDNCILAGNPAQLDCDGDGIGDACSSSDCDGDGVEDSDDNCVSSGNPTQADTDGDGLGDACD